MTTSPSTGSGTPTIGDVEHLGVLQVEVLDLRGVGVEAAHDDHVGEAPGDAQVAVGVLHPHVAGMEPAVADLLRGGLGLLVVAEHQASAPSRRPRPPRPGRARGRSRGRRSGPRSRRGQPDGGHALLDRIARARPVRAARRLGEPVDDERRPCRARLAVQDPPHDLHRDRRGPDRAGPQRAVVAVARRRGGRAW